jgi:hypothetical protein
MGETKGDLEGFSRVFAFTIHSPDRCGKRSLPLELRRRRIVNQTEDQSPGRRISKTSREGRFLRVGLAGFEPTKRNWALWIQGILDFTVISYTNDTIEQ